MPHGTHNHLLWENEDFRVYTPKNPHLPYSEGLQLVIEPNREVATSWEDPEYTGKAFALAGRLCQVVEAEGLAPWFNIQTNGNWGLVEGATPHVHVYGRNRESERWAKPIILPDASKTYSNDPMPEEHRSRLVEKFRLLLP